MYSFLLLCSGAGCEAGLVHKQDHFDKFPQDVIILQYSGKHPLACNSCKPASDTYFPLVTRISDCLSGFSRCAWRGMLPGPFEIDAKTELESFKHLRKSGEFFYLFLLWIFLVFKQSKFVSQMHQTNHKFGGELPVCFGHVMGVKLW